VVHALDRVAALDLPDGGAATVDTAERLGRERAARQATVFVDSTSGRHMSVGELRRVPAFEAIGADQAARLLAAAREITVRAGDAVIERWALARTFYLVRSGALEVRIDDHLVNTLGPGDHFGEVGAIDWGRDFGYGRTATVIATEDTRLVTIPAAALRALMAESPDVDRAIRRIAQERLASR
jgi:CRP-like cAMP-binding protein